MNLARWLVGPVQQEPLDLCLRQTFPEARFFRHQDDLHSLIKDVRPAGILLLEPLQRVLPAGIWQLELPLIGLGSQPLACTPAIAQRVLLALNGFIPLEQRVLSGLPEGLPVSREIVWTLGSEALAADRPQPLMRNGYLQPLPWSPQMAIYARFPEQIYYFKQFHPARLPFYLQRLQRCFMDLPWVSSLHFQVLAAGAELWLDSRLSAAERACLPTGSVRYFEPAELEAALAEPLLQPAADLRAYQMALTLETALADLWPRLCQAQRQDPLELELLQLSLLESSLALQRFQRVSVAYQGPWEHPLQANFLLRLLNSDYLLTTPQQLFEGLQAHLQALPEPSDELANKPDKALYQLYAAICQQDFQQALGLAEGLLASEYGPDALSWPAPWMHDPIYQELVQVVPTADVQPHYIAYLRVLAWAGLNQLSEAHRAVAELLEKAYFPSGAQLWKLSGGPVWSSAAVRLQLERHPQNLELAELYIKTLGEHNPEVALQQAQHYQRLIPYLLTQTQEIERFFKLERDLLGVSAAAVPYLMWEGPLYTYSSLAGINREWIQRLAADKEFLLTFIPYEVPEWPEQDRHSDWQNKQLHRLDLFVSHRWPLRQQAPAAGKWLAVFPWEFGAIPQTWATLINQQMDRVWVPSQFVAESFCHSGVKPERLSVLPNGVDTQLYQPQGPQFELASSKRFRFLFVGGTLIRKGIDILLKAYQQAFTAEDDVCLVIKGFGKHSHYALQSWLPQTQAADQAEVLWLEQELTPQEMASLYRSCQVYVHPYRGEGFGMPILEAMACGLPVIIPNAGPAPEFCSAEAGWFLSTRLRPEAGRDVQGFGLAQTHPYLLEVDHLSLVALLQAAYTDPAAVAAKGKVARQEAEAYDWEQLYLQLKTELLELSQACWWQRQSAPDLDAFRQLSPSQRKVHLQQLPVNSLLWQGLLPELTAAERFAGWARLLAAGLPSDTLRQLAPLYLPEVPLQLPVRVQLAEVMLPLKAPQSSEQAQFVQAGSFTDMQLSLNPATRADILYLLSDHLPTELQAELIWYAQPALKGKLLLAGYAPEQLLEVPLGLDFTHFQPAAEPLVLEESVGRFVFLSIFDWRESTHWQELLRAYCLGFRADEPVNYVFKPYGAPLEQILPEIEAWLQDEGLDPEAIPNLTFVQEELAYADLPAFYRGTDCFLAPLGNPLWALAAQACELPVISRGHFGFLERPYSEVYRSGDPEQLAWLLRQHWQNPHPTVARCARLDLQGPYGQPAWEARLEDALIRSYLLKGLRAVSNQAIISTKTEIK